MKKLILLTLFFNGFMASSQVFDVDTLLFNGTNRINLVILPDGYQASEFPQFLIDANNILDKLLLEKPYAEYANYFNAFIINVPSNESGANHPATATDVTEPAHPADTVDNYFGSTFDYYNIHRLLVPINTSAINNVLANNFPLYDQVVVLVNTPYYGGSGGQFATTSLHSSAAEIAIHEIGHSFSDLIDEYYAGDFYSREGINMTQNTNPLSVKWKNWHGGNGIGIYQHCCGGNSATWYRPHQNCKMRYLGSPFCSVCIEGTIEKIHSLVSPLDSYSPVSTTISPSVFPAGFTVDLIKPIPNTLNSKWNLNNILFAANVDTVLLNPGDLIIGANTLTAVIVDTTTLLRVDNHASTHVYSVTWNINYNTTGISSVSSSELEVNIYPNPAVNILNINFNSNTTIKDVTVEVLNIEGKKIKSYLVSDLNKLLTVNLDNFEKGIYFVNIYNNKSLLTSNKVIKN